MIKNKKEKQELFHCNFFPKNSRGLKPMLFTKKNRKGWIKIVEAFIAILLITSVLLIVVNKGVEKKDISSQIYDVQISILREIQLNNSLRTDILDTDPPLEWDNENFPTSIKDKINSRILNYLECKAKICKIDDITCELSEYPKEDVYAETGIITTTLETPEEKQLKQLKIFCWIK